MSATRGGWRVRSLIKLAAALVAVVFVGVALADQITPDGDTLTAGDQSTVSLGTVAPGTVLTPKTSFKLDCNGNKHLDNGQTVNLTFSLAGSTVPLGGSLSAGNASIGPAPANWADDGDQCPGQGSTPGTPLSPLADNGDSTVTITAPSTTGVKTFVVAWTKDVGAPDVTGASITVTYTFTVAPPADTTPPVISYALTPGSPDGNNGWYRSNVSLVWTVTEAESPGSLVKTGCVDQNITADQAATTYSCSATSTGGSAGPVSVTIKRDATAPSAETTLDSLPNGTNDWYTTSPDWTTDGEDSLSGLVNDPCETGTYSGPEGTGLTVSGTCTDNAGNSTSDDSPSFKYDATGPSAVLAVTAGTLGDNDWYTSDVTVETDGTDAISSPTTCTADQFQTTETTGQVFNGSCTNDAGLTTNAAPLSVKLDKTGPSAALAVTAGTLGDNDWYTSDVTVDTDGTDSISNPTTCTADQFQTTETTGTVFSGSCTNDAGLTTNAAPLSVKLDKTGPSAALAVTAGTLGGGGWYRTDVTVSTTGADTISSPVTCSPDQQQTTSTNGQAFNGACTNNAGLMTNATPLTVKLDKIAPTLTWTGGPANGGSYYFGSVPAAPTCTAVDPLYSGPNGCTVGGYDSAVGLHTMTATAFDLAGNSSGETRTYTVLAWTLTGFFQPVDMNGTFNVVKNGSTVPLKFRVFAGPTELTEVANVMSLRYGVIACNATAPVDDIETVATGGTVLRYDGGQFIYNWKTPSMAGKCVSVTVTTVDGSTLSAYFKLK